MKAILEIKNWGKSWSYVSHLTDNYIILRDNHMYTRKFDINTGYTLDPYSVTQFLILMK